MTVIAVSILLLSIAMLAYVHVVYPVLMAFLARTRTRVWKKDDALEPTVSIILAAHNEEAVLERCLSSLLQLEYPADKVEILIGSDGSKDRTNAILIATAAQYPMVRPMIFGEQRGKSAVVNDLVSAATGEILLFTDADVTFPANAIRSHVRNYASEEVGGVSGALRFYSAEGGGAYGTEQDYLSMEYKLRVNEGKVHSTVGIFGGNYSIRRHLWRALPSEPLCDELYTSLSVIEQGYRVICDETALSSELYTRSVRDESKRKIRFAARGFNTAKFFPGFLGRRGGVISLMLWSHKLLRYLTPFFFGGIFFAAVLGVMNGLPSFQALLTFCFAVLSIGILGGLLERIGFSIPGLKQAYWFLSMNAAFARGTLRFVTGREQEAWVPTARVAIKKIGGTV